MVNGEQGVATLCTICGGDLDGEGACQVCGAKHEVRNGRVQAQEGEASKEAFLAELAQVPGVGSSTAETLWANGFRGVAQLRGATVEALSTLEGIGETLARRIHDHLHPPSERKAPPPGEDEEVLARWLKGDDGDFESWLAGEAPSPALSRPAEKALSQGPEPREEAHEAPEASSAEKAPEAAAPSGDDGLRRWLLGDETGLEDWLAQPEEPAEAPSGGEEAEGGVGTAGEAEDGDLAELRAELQEMKRAIRAELAKIKEGHFDPVAYLEEIAKLNRKLHREVKQRKELESELDHLKKSSVAVIKYVKTQRQEGDPEAKQKLVEERELRRRLEEELQQAQGLLSRLRKELEGRLQEIPEGARAVKELEVRLAEKEVALQGQEDALRRREEELASVESRAMDQDLEHRLQAELAEKGREFLDREAELKRKTIELEAEVERYKIEAKLRAEAAELTGKGEDAISEELAAKAKELQRKERDLLLREEEGKRLREELGFKEEELQKLKAPVAYKEEEILRREEDLIYREKRLEAEKRRLEQAMAKVGSLDEVQLKERLEQLKAEISRKEEEVRAKEKYLQAKMEELRRREQGLIEEEIDARDEDRQLEIQQEKVKTGTPRLDDLLLGGIPFGSNVSVYGPPFVGKEVVVNAFVAEGLRKGVPAIWVISDKTPDDIREEMQYVVAGYEEYERLGLVRYVDAYSKGMGTATEDPNVTYVDDPTDAESILRAVDEMAATIKQAYPYYRLAFRSISTLMAYMDPASMFRFLQPFAGRRKRDRAVSMYVIEKGMHGEQEIQMLGTVMDGMVDFKVEQLKTYMSVKGIGDAQSRAWIQYMYSKQAISIGSFSLDHIR